MQAYEYSVDLMRQEFAAAIKGKYDAIERLQAVVVVFQKISAGSPISGGCPVVNTAVQANNTHPQLQNCARQTMIEWQEFIIRIAQSGIERGQLHSETDPEMLATLLISTLEGAIMLTQLHQDASYMDHAITHLTSHLESLALSDS